MISVQQECLDKLNPGVLRVSPKFSAYLSYLLEAKPPWTEPAVFSLSVTSDDFLIVDFDGVDSAAELRKNIEGAAAVVGLSEEARDWLLAKCRYRL